jgi:hypothetical protein
VPFLQLAQLRVIEAAGALLAVSGDEGDSCAFAQQIDSGGDLLGLHAQLGGNAGGDRIQGNPLW